MDAAVIFNKPKKKKTLEERVKDTLYIKELYIYLLIHLFIYFVQWDMLVLRMNFLFIFWAGQSVLLG